MNVGTQKALVITGVAAATAGVGFAAARTGSLGLVFGTRMITDTWHPVAVLVPTLAWVSPLMVAGSLVDSRLGASFMRPVALAGYGAMAAGVAAGLIARAAAPD